jgi:trigger factor
VVLRATPLPIQNQLKRDCGYGCSICGCPLLEYVQINPSDKTSEFLPENMAAICPNHNQKFCNYELPRTQLFDFKTKPHNKINANNAFAINSPQLTVNIGKTKFINTYRILSVDDFDLVAIRKENNLYLVLDINFFDVQNNLIGVVSENSWSTDKREGWSIDYEPRHLKIRNATKRISFEAKIEYDEIFVTADMYYNGVTINVSKEQILLENIEQAIELKGTTLKNYDVGISLQTR